MNKEGSRRKRQRFTESLRDMLLNLGIHNRRDWFEYIEKTRSSRASDTFPEQSGRNLEKDSTPYPPDKQKRKIERTHRFLKKLMEQELQKNTVIVRRKSRLSRSMGKVFSVLFNQGPIEQISSLVFTIFTITKSVVEGIKIRGIQPHEPHERSFHIFPPHTDEPIAVIMDRIAAFCSGSPDHSVNN
ncbi:uncharacterized protein LOC26526157 [Drosophila erecta]|uniref:uncharacterized protein LOC26526157 n=1 Tax=Drosophila erecta TaxID=7220 RepID=UPI000F046CF5|nr:uncharacterized protein LOC26526157 [Drosophila erecta]